ncbi:UNVERIFIED_CONTAM: hypothetical protein HDU68_010813, partial [Siphonaria sp. JEL0065]
MSDPGKIAIRVDSITSATPPVEERRKSKTASVRFSLTEDNRRVSKTEENRRVSIKADVSPISEHASTPDIPVLEVSVPIKGDDQPQPTNDNDDDTRPDPTPKEEPESLGISLTDGSMKRSNTHIAVPNSSISRRSSLKPPERAKSQTTPKQAIATTIGGSVAPTSGTVGLVMGKAVPLASAGSDSGVCNRSLGTLLNQSGAPPMGSQMNLASNATGYVNPLFQDMDTPVVKKPKANKEKRKMSLGAALCIPPPPRIDNNMNFKKVLKLSMGAI